MYYIDESLNDTEFTAAGDVAATFGGTPRRIESITIHHWGSFGQTHDGVVDFFVNRNRNTSAHFVVSEGRIHCLVSPADAAWAAGNAYGNATSIHIECHPEATDGDYATVAWLVKFLRDNYGAGLPLKAHREWSATACPGIWDLARVDREARALGSAAPAPAPKPAPAPAPAGLPPYCIVEANDTLGGIAVQFGVSLPALIAANPGINPNLIFPGQRIELPKAAPSGLPPYCIVEANDTLGGIAVQFGVSLDHVLRRNPGINPNLIFPGQRINL
ncbi:LysM peptidoglycan-binding domain-containing protein [Arthrobacter sp. B2a2-09]|uniref:LysM peptidoglycan-binding domain-containing protein n=1 Tax=Arthrobacter sp. B2a2-09 TaxID=2952822 RepID=UPI0022CD9665|nr:LysM peptidoglycan-binding domain-containing protein [Arthrobacter sp. B2a2-09]MCZ9884632.1 LysM peptidoglycan-binding domain-containing protein [Arthrobacter sp. B2a2-09]